MNMALENSMHLHLTAPLGLHRPKIKDDYGMFFTGCPREFDKMVIEKWPIIQIYGVEGVGR